MQQELALTLPHQEQIVLAEHAAVIRALGKRVVGDVIEIGRRLTECKAQLGHGNWLPWLETEFGWTDDTALNFMRAHELAKSRNFRDLSIGVSALYLLAAPSTPDAVRTEVLDLAANGEHLTHAQVKEMIAEFKADVATEHARELQRLRIELSEREAAIRASYDAKLVFDDQQEMLEWVEKQMAPLRKQIEDYEKKVAKFEKRDKDERDEKKEPPKIDANISLAATAIVSAAELFVRPLDRISIEQMIDIERKGAHATGEQLRDRLGPTLARAKIIGHWAAEFIKAVESIDE